MIRRTFVALTMLATVACGAPRETAPSVFPALALGVGSVTDAYEYRHAPDDPVNVEWQEAYHRWALDALQVSVPRRIRYNKYKSRAHMNEVIGVGNTNGFANGETFDIHTIWSIDNHEVVHLYSSVFGRAVALWSEGLAVAFQTDPAKGDFVPRWSGVRLDDHARTFRAEGRLLSIAGLLTTDGFRRFDANVTYPQAGSFMRHILESCGLDGVKRLFAAGSPTDSADTVSRQFEATCGQTVAAAEQAWLAKLELR